MGTSNVSTRVKNLEEILNQLNDEIRQKNETAEKIENEIVKRNAVIERKQSQIDQYNKKIEQLKNKDGVSYLKKIYFSNNTKDKICVVELTVGFETNVAKIVRKAIRYKDLCSSLKQRFGNVKYLNLSMHGINRNDRQRV